MSLGNEAIDLYEDVSNPLDSVEEILCANDWIFDRMTEDELTVQITGKMGEYKLFFHWQEEFSAMRFSCQYDLEVREDATGAAAKTMTEINSDLWLGHFSFRETSAVPCFRHTTLFRGMTQTSGADHIQDMVDIALAECERFYPVFEMFSRGLPEDIGAMRLAMMPIAGES